MHFICVNKHSNDIFGINFPNDIRFVAFLLPLLYFGTTWAMKWASFTLYNMNILFMWLECGVCDTHPIPFNESYSRSSPSRNWSGRRTTHINDKWLFNHNYFISFLINRHYTYNIPKYYLQMSWHWRFKKNFITTVAATVLNIHISYLWTVLGSLNANIALKKPWHK